MSRWKGVLAWDKGFWDNAYAAMYCPNYKRNPDGSWTNMTLPDPCAIQVPAGWRDQGPDAKKRPYYEAKPRKKRDARRRIGADTPRIALAHPASRGNGENLGHTRPAVVGLCDALPLRRDVAAHRGQVATSLVCADSSGDSDGFAGAVALRGPRRRRQLHPGRTE